MEDLNNKGSSIIKSSKQNLKSLQNNIENNSLNSLQNNLNNIKSVYMPDLFLYNKEELEGKNLKNKNPEKLKVRMRKNIQNFDFIITVQYSQLN